MNQGREAPRRRDGVAASSSPERAAQEVDVDTTPVRLSLHQGSGDTRQVQEAPKPKPDGVQPTQRLQEVRCTNCDSGAIEVVGVVLALAALAAALASLMIARRQSRLAETQARLASEELALARAERAEVLAERELKPSLTAAVRVLPDGVYLVPDGGGEIAEPSDTIGHRTLELMIQNIGTRTARAAVINLVAPDGSRTSPGRVATARLNPKATPRSRHPPETPLAPDLSGSTAAIPRLPTRCDCRVHASALGPLPGSA